MDIFSKLNSFVTGSQANERYRDSISINYDQALEIINLINKPVETTNEQLTKKELIDIHYYIKKAFNSSSHEPELERLNELMKKIRRIV